MCLRLNLESIDSVPKGRTGQAYNDLPAMHPIALCFVEALTHWRGFPLTLWGCLIYYHGYL